jgi:hypothetical protein
MSTARTILICGGGNGAHCLSTLAASRENLEVNVLTLVKKNINETNITEK